MNALNKILATGLIGISLGVQPILAATAPQLTIPSERAAHPRIVEAINKMHQTLKELEAASDDFGGNKATAIADIRRAIHSLKKALYYRLKMDDEALERAQ